jgi:DNA modification methylase
MNRVFHEDCVETLGRDLSYDYAITSPPEFSELGLEPVEDAEKYFQWLRQVFEKLNPTRRIFTVVISDRRHGGKIIPKHARCLEIMSGLGWELLSEKIWEKSVKSSFFRINFAFVLTFCKEGHEVEGRKLTNGHYDVPAFAHDVWVIPHKSVAGYSYNFPKELVKKCLENFTKKGDTVFDPFMGSGTTALACIDLGRNYLGSEIAKDTHSLCLRRLGKNAPKTVGEDAL